MSIKILYLPKQISGYAHAKEFEALYWGKSTVLCWGLVVKATPLAQTEQVAEKSWEQSEGKLLRSPSKVLQKKALKEFIFFIILHIL